MVGDIISEWWARSRRNPHACFDDPEHPDFVKFMEDLEDALSKLGAEGDDRRRRYLGKRFRDIRGRVKRKLNAGVASYAIRRRLTPDLKWSKEQGCWRHGLPLEPKEIEIVAKEDGNTS